MTSLPHTRADVAHDACVQVLILFSPRGVPVSPRFMNGYGSHTFKWVNKEGQYNWVKFHFKTNQVGQLLFCILQWKAQFRTQVARG